MKSSSADTLSPASRLRDETARSDAAQVNPRHQRDCGERDERLPGKRQRNKRQRDDEERRRIVGRRHEAADVERKDHRARRDRARKSCDKRGPSREKRGQPPVRRAQVHIFAAGARAQRRQLRVGHRPGERQQSARDPDAEEHPRMRHAGRD